MTYIQEFKDYKNGIKYIKMSANNNNIDAIEYLVMAYTRGIDGNTKAKKKSIYWLKKYHKYMQENK